MDIRKLLIKHAAGNCTPGEREQLIAWLQQGGDPELLPDPEELADTGEEQPGLGPAASVRVMEYVLDIQTPPAGVRYRRLLIRFAAAAALIAVIVGVYQWLPRQRAALSTIHTGYGQISRIMLPDGSAVTLNANTILKYDSIMLPGKAREVWLQGEAFFDIRPAAGVFTVHAGQALDIAVLGTQFNVHNNDSTIQVVLNSGCVKVSAADSEHNSAMVLEPGEMAVYHNAAKQLSKQSADTMALTGWKDNVLTFRQARLSAIAAVVQRQFGVEVLFAQPQLDTLLFTGTAPANDLALFLSILERSLDIRIDKPNNRQIVIRPAH
ncbi:DUF4974 domain-containing protein [Chitinophaga agrisoli]|uniref:DUF4974 domain-containing protein n=1 Tax=Chitinophaga agrisoli TaxID=2607653 RepID=A0A5B2VNE8_9BACT|nr:FecR domain-containing protein [Chitinophaga agrisoli]KAA2240621.1 DUF4974 domain-containing protein [Chitinophaga agrisoli]